MICTSLTIASLCKRLTPIVNVMYKRQEITKIKENMKFMALNNLCSQKKSLSLQYPYGVFNNSLLDECMVTW